MKKLDNNFSYAFCLFVSEEKLKFFSTTISFFPLQKSPMLFI